MEGAPVIRIKFTDLFLTTVLIDIEENFGSWVGSKESIPIA